MVTLRYQQGYEPAEITLPVRVAKVMGESIRNIPGFWLLTWPVYTCWRRCILSEILIEIYLFYFLLILFIHGWSRFTSEQIDVPFGYMWRMKLSRAHASCCWCSIDIDVLVCPIYVYECSRLLNHFCSHNSVATGVTHMIVTNACGGLNAEYNVGDLMIINDHINLPGLAFNHPLVGKNIDEFGTRFPAVSPILMHKTIAIYRVWKPSIANLTSICACTW